MAILTTSNLLSEQRYDISDARRIESGVRNDFDETVTSIITNTSQGYIIRGFSLVTAGAVGSPANDLLMVVDPGAVLHIAASVSGTIFQTPTGTINQILNASSNTNVSGSFTANSTNYVGIDYNRFADPSTDVTKYIWNSAANDEIPTIAPAAQTLTYKIIITTSVWAANVLPVAIVSCDSNGNVVSITDARWMLYSLETGGINPNPNFVYPWSEGRIQPPVTISSINSSSDPFSGGDKQIDSLKAWMNAIMSELLEIKGTPFWFSGPSISPPIPPLPTLISLFEDLSNTVITGSGEISNGILPNADPILVTTGNISASSNQLSSLASTTGLVNGDFIFGTGIPSGTTILSIVGSTVTMSQNATMNGTTIGITFYDPSVITNPGQINWNDPISIRVIGSSLSYIIAANPSSTDITLTDDEVAYIILNRDVVIAPHLIFTAGSPVVTSVGSVVWTSGFLPGDYIKVTANNFSGYYKILTVDSGFQVTLTSNVVAADNFPGGVSAQSAFGTYHASATPVGDNRAIQISSRANVPVGGNIFWLFVREDNGGSPRVYIRFLSEELDNGESVNVGGTTSLELLQYIGSPSAAASAPQYVASLGAGSVAQISSITVGAASTMTGGQYFYIYSSGDARLYAVWVKKSGVGTQPNVAGPVSQYLEWDILSGDSATAVATKLAIVLNGTSSRDFTATSSSGVVTVTNNSAGVTTVPSVGTIPSPFAVSVTTPGVGQGNFIIQDGQNLTLAIKELDEAIGELSQSLNSPNYDEALLVVASGASGNNQINGPISSSSIITIPLNSRESNVQEFYTVGAAKLEVYLNGQKLILGDDYAEVGTATTSSDQIQVLQNIVVGDILEFRISSGGGGLSGGGPAGPAGPPGVPGANAAGGPVSISTKNGPTTYTVLLTDCFLEANCAGGTVNFDLPTAASATGRIFYFKKVDSSFSYMNVIANGGDLIDGIGTISTNTQYEEFSLISNGTSWDLF